jgi:hypothetical protein
VVFEEAGGNDVGTFFSFSLSFDSGSLGFSSFSLDFFELPAVSLLLVEFEPFMKQEMETYIQDHQSQSYVKFSYSTQGRTHFTNKALSHGNIYIRCTDSVAVFQERSPKQELIMSFD